MPKKKREKFYCGDKDDIPKDYKRRGSRYECLRKGVGVGLYVLAPKSQEERSSQSDVKKKKSEKELLKEEKRKPLKVTKKEFKNFIDNNWEGVKKSSKKNRDIFYKLARLYADENV